MYNHRRINPNYFFNSGWRMKKLISQRAALLFMVTALVVAILGILPLTPAQGAAILSITPITWDVIGLDSNNLAAGPDTFPVECAGVQYGR